MNSPLITALGTTLFHFLWEGALIALLLAAFRTEPKTRYRLACIAMLAMPAAFFITLFTVMPESFPSFPPAGSLPLPRLAPAVAAAPRAASLLEQLAESMRWFVPVWFAGMAIFSLRGVLGWVETQRLRSSACAAFAWQSRLTALSTQLGITQAVVLVESRFVDVPMVTGVLRPAILLPAGLLTGLPADQIEYILLHELAHIRRFDYAMNLLQTAIETLLFYHPAVWWVSNTLRRQREHCCDDIVLSTGADPGLYAKTLHALEQARPSLAIAATGGALETRIRRILGIPASPGLSAAPLLVVCSLAAAFLAAQTAPLQDYAKWLNDEVQYIIQNDERQAFLALHSDTERAQFIEQFWLRRDPTPGTPANEYTEEHYRRLAYTASHFGPKTDCARVYITYGPPDEIDSHPQGDATIRNPWEQWRYRYIAGMGADVKILFSDVGHTGQFPMTMDPLAKLTPWQRWLNEDVVYIVRLEERQAFNALTTDAERRHFIEQFWQLRGTAAKEKHYRRLAYAHQHFPEPDLPGWQSDRGRTYIVYGPPDAIEAHPSDPIPSEMWRYNSNHLTMTFRDTAHSGRYGLTN